MKKCISLERWKGGGASPVDAGYIPCSKECSEDKEDEEIGTAEIVKNKTPLGASLKSHLLTKRQIFKLMQNTREAITFICKIFFVNKEIQISVHLEILVTHLCKTKHLPDVVTIVMEKHDLWPLDWQAG